MNPIPKTVAVLDACVLYPAPIRDLLLHIAALDGFQPKWSAIIQEVWKRNLLVKRPDLQASQLARTIIEMDRAFPDANVSDFETIQLSKPLPDPGDEHVMAAAIKCNAMFIVTFNLKDFPKPILKPHACPYRATSRQVYFGSDRPRACNRLVGLQKASCIPQKATQVT